MSNFKEEDKVKIANIITRLKRLDDEIFTYYIGERSVGKKEFYKYIRSKINDPLARTPQPLTH